MTIEVQGRRRRPTDVLPLTAMCLDLAVIALTVLLASAGRDSTLIFRESADVIRLSVSGPLIVIGWIVITALRGGYQTEIFGAGIDEYKRVASAAALTAAVVGIGSYLAKYQLSRGFYVLAFVIGVPLLLLGRWALRAAIKRARKQGRLRERVLLVGAVDHVDEIATVLGRESWLGYDVVGALTPPSDPRTSTPTGIPVLANTSDVSQVALDLRPELVLFAGGGTASASEMRQIVWSLEDERVHVAVAPSVTDVARERIRVRPVAGLPLVHVDKPRTDRALRLAKRSFDIVGATALLVLGSPLMAMAAIRIRRHDSGPVLFRQRRVGRGGVPFDCLKFRTMAAGAEDQHVFLVRAQGAPTGMFKLKEDPRVTPPGRWLRRYSLDELPQLWNVLRGEMSLVGPRPPLPSEVETYNLVASRRLRVRPGMTGLWQVSGRSNLSWPETVRLDLYYVDNWSMLQDLSILIKTVRAVLRADGAY